jgi:hypothetical protein
MGLLSVGSLIVYGLACLIVGIIGIEGNQRIALALLLGVCGGPGIEDIFLIGRINPRRANCDVASAHLRVMESGRKEVDLTHLILASARA